jgi:hypothetical protein
MTRNRKTLSACIALGLSVLPAAPARADGEQLVFVGFAGPRASLNTSVAGGATRAVYLRWDTTEGSLAAALPADASVKLFRNGVEVRAFTPGLSTPTAADVASAYGGAANARRRAEMVARLDAVVRGEGGHSSVQVTNANFDQKLAEFLDVTLPVPYTAGLREQHEVWARTAARLDITVASLIGRGYIDTAAPAGVVRYDLLADSPTAGQRVLGTTVVDTTKDQVLGPAADLAAVTHDLGRCDAPEDGRVQGVVGLSWDHAGPNRSTRFLNALATGGYDLYRTTGTCGPAVPLRDLRAEVAGRAPDAKGAIALPGLVKVNDDTLIDISPPPADGREVTPNARSWRPAFTQYLEDRKTLEAAGFQAGESLCYYLVARDSSGNYGQTAAISAIVGDTLDPPAPWDIEAVPESNRLDGGGGVAVDDDRMVLRWASIDVPTYVQDHHLGRAICNLAEAQNTGRLVHAEDASACGRKEGHEVNLDVVAYNVYRFETEAEAQDFSDSDGDGYSDADEQVADGPGLSCDAGASPAGMTNYRVATVAAGDPTYRRVRGGRVEYEFSDTTPAGTKGTIYFYRVAAIGRTPQQIGEPGIPVRALFPDETKPTRPTEEEVFFGACLPYAILSDHPSPDNDFGIESYAAFDTIGRSTHVRFSCPDELVRELFVRPGYALGEIETIPAYDGVADGPRIAPFDLSVCKAVDRAPCEFVTAEFLDSDGRVIGAVEMPAQQPAGCERGLMEGMLIPTLVQEPLFREDLHGQRAPGCSQDTGLVQPGDGDVVEGPIGISLLLAADECATLNVEREGQVFRLDSQCGTFLTEWNPPAEGGELECVSLYKTNKNNQPSAVLNLPCVKFRPKVAPRAPIISRFVVPGDATPISIEWYGPNQAIGGIIVEVWRNDDAGGARLTQFFGAEGVFGNTRVHTSSLPHGQPALAGSDLEEWCIQARSVGVGTPSEGGSQLSPLTKPMCVARRAPAAELPTYLGWPTIPKPPQRPALKAQYLTGDRVMVIPFGPVAFQKFCARRPVGDLLVIIDGGAACYASQSDPPTACQTGAPPEGCGDGRCVDPCLNEYGYMGDSPALCANARTGLGENTRFVAYRQARNRATLEVSPYEQVSPFLEKPFCRVKSNLDPLEPSHAAGIVHDPHLTLVPLDLGSGAQYYASYVDRTPFIGGQDYRYQLVYFDDRGEIAAYADTQWITEVP